MSNSNDTISECPIDHSKFSATGNIWESLKQPSIKPHNHIHLKSNTNTTENENENQLSINDENVRHSIIHELTHKHPEHIPLDNTNLHHNPYYNVSVPVLSDDDSNKMKQAHQSSHLNIPTILQPIANIVSKSTSIHEQQQHQSTIQHGSHTSDSYNSAVNDAFPTDDAKPLPHQRIPLSTRRTESTIPRAGIDEKTGLPHSKWVYPSEQRFFNAMTKKGFSPNEIDVPAIVTIHNTINEHSWSKVLELEAPYKMICPNPRLARIVGRPDSLSLKARFNTTFRGYSAPFDRHDWYIDRCGQEVRYILDFYEGPQTLVQSSTGEMVPVAAAPFVDVRPANRFLDSIQNQFLKLQKRD